MPFHKLPVLTASSAAVIACTAVLFAASPVSAAPQADGKGYVDSTARCTSPAIAVMFGSTESSRVAICRDSDGSYEYRGVRVRDGARLILPASPTGDGGFVATSDGVSYTVSSSGLEVVTGSKVIRDEPMLDFHGDTGSAATAPSPNSGSATPPTTKVPPPTAAAPIDPLPAEGGGSGRPR